MINIVRVYSVGGVEVGRVPFAAVDAKGAAALIHKRLRSRRWVLCNGTALKMLGSTMLNGSAVQVCDVLEGV